MGFGLCGSSQPCYYSVIRVCLFKTVTTLSGVGLESGGVLEGQKVWSGNVTDEV